MATPAATLPSTQNLQTQAGLLPIAPRPSAVPPVVPQDSTPAGAFSCIGTRTRRRYNSEGLSKVNKVREDGACLRCKLYRIGCDRERPCSACQKVSGSAKIFRGPCINPRLDTVQAFRAGDGDNGTFIPTLPNLRWVSQTQTTRSKLGATFTPVLEHQSESSLMPATSMTIEITWPFNADIITKCPATRLNLDRFEPNGQSLAEEWTPVNAGETRMVKLPPLACRDTEAASKAIESFLDECQRPLEQHISGMLHDPILKLTWAEVLRFRDTSRNPALTSAVRMYAAVLMNTRYPKSVRANIFDVAEEPEPPFFFEGNLLPPQLTYQIQMLIAQGQIKMQNDVIRALKHLMFPKRHTQWYTIFLITFVLLSCIELMHHNQTSFLQLKRKNSETNRINVSNVTRHMLGEWEDSAENLINHFRYVTRGNVLFSQQGSSFERSLASSKLDHGAETYIKRMREVTSGRIGEMLGMRESRKASGERHNMWAICELFLPEDTDLP